MTFEENLAFGLELRKFDRQERKRRVREAVETLGLVDLLDRKPSALSSLRVTMRASLARLHVQLAVTTVYVTHDQVEAMTLGQRVAVPAGA